MANVYLVGAGPGDPDLMTVKGLRLIQQADVLIYDRLANPVLLEQARPDAEKIYAGKEAARHALTQDEINSVLIDRAQRGKMVVRLKGGDPFVFGRGGEEAEEVIRHGLSYEVVPGITSAIAVPAYAGIPVTHRDVTATLTIVTGHEDPTKGASTIPWPQLATNRGTLIFLMGAGNLAGIVEQLMLHGRPTNTPVAVIQWGTLPSQRTVIVTLETAVAAVQNSGIGAPAVIVVGEVVNLHQTLGWIRADAATDGAPIAPLPENNDDESH